MERRIELSEPIHGFTERDAHSKALLNTDLSGLMKYKLQRERHFQSIQEMNKVKSDIVSLKGELREIKELLLMISKKNCI
ncbi:MAG: hypothetical protein EBW87_04485 [Burkholderiaceae bacterium]|nr:hypothetical protein [Burkholderiaceae bacterium]